MKITKYTRLKELLPFLTSKEKIESILSQIEEYPLEKDITSMTIGEFSEIVMDEESYITKIMRPRERAYIALGRLKSFRRQMEQLMNYIKKFQIKQSADEKQAALNIDFPDMLSRMLITTAQFFTLHSFTEAENIPLADYLLILKDNSSSIQYQRKYQQIIDSKSKSKRSLR